MILFSLPHHYCNHTYTPRGGRMEVAILRVCASVLCEGDFGLAGVVIGYTYKCLFLPVPHVRLKLPNPPPPTSLFLPPCSLLSPHRSPQTWLHFRHEWGVKRESKAMKKKWVRRMIDLKNKDKPENSSCTGWKKKKKTEAHTYTH